MNHKIIVVDDEYETRQGAYQRLALAINSLDPSLSIELEYLENNGNLSVMLRTNLYVGCIMDAVLNIGLGWTDFNITKALNCFAGKGIPIAIVSSQWDATNAEQIAEALRHENYRTFLHWRDIDVGHDKLIKYAAQSIWYMITRHLDLDPTLTLGPDDPIRIVHISDVHSGGHDQNLLRIQAHADADRIITYWKNQRPTFVACTGDLSQCGSPSQYRLFHDWIKYFFERLFESPHDKLPARNLFLVPGNHDVNLSLAAAVKSEMVKDITGKTEVCPTDKEMQPDLRPYAYAPFRDFLEEVCDCPLLNRDISDLSFAWVESRFRYRGVIFYGINTAWTKDFCNLPGKQVDDEMLAAIGVELEESVKSCGNNPPPLVIGLGHHRPLCDGGEKVVENPDAFGNFFGNGPGKTALFLNGHAHQHGLSYETESGLQLVLSCPLPATQERDPLSSQSLQGFNLLTLERKDHVVTGLTAVSFEWVDKTIQERETKTWKRGEGGMFEECPEE